jgi:hypothetical protein
VERACRLETWLISTLHHQFFASAGRSRSDRLADFIIGTARTCKLTLCPITNPSKHQELSGLKRLLIFYFTPKNPPVHIDGDKFRIIV